MSRIVVNSTPIIVLGNSGNLDLLKYVFGSIVIPEAVLSEVTSKNDDAAKALLRFPHWIEVKKAPRPAEMSLLPAKLHAGEIEVILLARQIDADAVVLDDNAARKAASFLGLQVTGTLGVLLAAKQLGHIETIKPIVQSLQGNGFRISQKIVRYVLDVAGEQP